MKLKLAKPPTRVFSQKEHKRAQVKVFIFCTFKYCYAVNFTYEL